MHYSCNTVNAPKGETENISRSWQLFTAQPLQADRLQHVDLGRRCFPFVQPPCRSSERRLVQLKCCSGRVSALAGRLWVRSRPGHNKDCKNGTHSFPAWHCSIRGLEVGGWITQRFPGVAPLLPTAPSGDEVSNAEDKFCIVLDVTITETFPLMCSAHPELIFLHWFLQHSCR